MKERYHLLLYVCKWLILCLVIGSFVAVVSAGFLYSLSWAINWQFSHQWGIFMLPVYGAIIGFLYHYFGQELKGGNNLVISEFHTNTKPLPFRMAPFIWLSTFLTHFGGGSAGRESTAVQMGASLADQLTKVLKLSERDRKVILIAGVSAGFSAIFGTPLGAAFFALEMLIVREPLYRAVMPAFLTAVVANQVHSLLGVEHTHYSINTFTSINLESLLWVAFAGVLFGLTASLFTRTLNLIEGIFKKAIAYVPLRPIIGGIVLLIVFLTIRYLEPHYIFRYEGLGTHVIEEAFASPSNWFDFLAKLLLTALTLGCGFKGGETTPLFFTGATLGSFLSLFIPLPTDLLAAVGFVAVFAGASNTPIACMLMGIELFGMSSGIFMTVACVASFVVSGNSGIYPAQLLFQPKNEEFKP